MKKFKNILIALFACFVIISLFVFQKDCVSSVIFSVKSFIYGVFPALFPFMAFCLFLSGMGALNFLKKIKFISKIFCCHPYFAYIFVCSALSGYPMGVKISCELYSRGEISQKDCVKLINSTCLCGGAFIYSVVCAQILQRESLFLPIFLSQIFSMLIISFIFNRIFYKNIPQTKISRSEKNKEFSFFGCINSAFSTMILICGNIIIFSLITVIFSKFMPCFSLIGGIFEMSGGCIMLENADIHFTQKILLCAFFTAFGGICVLMQCFCVMKEYCIQNKILILTKLLHGFLSAFSTYVLLRFQNVSQNVFRLQQKNILPHQDDTKGYIILAIFIIFLIIRLRCFQNHFYRNRNRR